MKICKKHPMTLVEVLIAFFILSILLTIVFGFFHELAKIDQFTRYQEEKTFQRRYLEFRLNHLFSHLVNESDGTRREFIFYAEAPSGLSKSTSLVFTYNNGVRQDATYAGDVVSRLYVNEKKQLCLLTWPLKAKNQDPYYGDMFKDVLCENVEKISFDFFAGSKPTVNQPLGPIRNRWQEEWQTGYKEMPVLMKIRLYITKTNNPLEKEDKEKNWEVSQQEPLIFMFQLPISKASNNFIYLKRT